MAFSKPKASPEHRGYDASHRAARKAFEANHHPSHPCVRCGRPLGPFGPHLHLDHNDTRTGYRGLAHARCNLKAGARRGALVANAKRQAIRVRPPRLFTSRDW